MRRGLIDVSESPDGRPDPGATLTPAEFVDAMRRLKGWADLTYRELERRAEGGGDKLARSTVTATLTRDSLPREELVVAFVRACGCDDAEVDLWITARRRIAAGSAPPPEPAPRSPGPTRLSRRRWLVPALVGGPVLVVLLPTVIVLASSGGTADSSQLEGTTVSTVTEDTYVTQIELRGTRANFTQLRACGAQCDGAADGHEKRILLKFQLDNLPAGACVRDARLRLWSKTTRDQDIGFTVHQLDPNSWDHATANWETQPQPGRELASHTGAVADQWMEFDLTPAVRTSGAHSFAVRSTGQLGGYFASREDTALKHPAELVVQHTKCA
nr:hypothetical protein [Kibdelosporangium sp. MJ126-NF4]